MSLLPSHPSPYIFNLQHRTGAGPFCLGDKQKVGQVGLESEVAQLLFQGDGSHLQNNPLLDRKNI